ncbi:hypothetical protein ACVDG3_06905 [Meridianimarinicoccus sp. RP-17]|uniref:hypothetical protein n=1 Tax=Meridianimarinicoccus zhengii TaxID=2056810 RepID=UPI000DAEDD4F|nr:hypothetical protein [Phycocomes zhengii]
MTPRQPKRADDEDLLNWLVLRDMGWPVSLIAAVWRVEERRVKLAMGWVRVDDAWAHRPQPVEVRA